MEEILRHIAWYISTLPISEDKLRYLFSRLLERWTEDEAKAINHATAMFFYKADSTDGSKVWYPVRNDEGIMTMCMILDKTEIEEILNGHTTQKI